MRKLYQLFLSYIMSRPLNLLGSSSTPTHVASGKGPIRHWYRIIRSPMFGLPDEPLASGSPPSLATLGAQYLAVPSLIRASSPQPTKPRMLQQKQSLHG